MGAWGCPSSRRFLLPDVARVPVSSTWNAGTGVGTITFDGPVLFDGAPFAPAFNHQTGSFTRPGTSIVQVTLDTIEVTTGPQGLAFAPAGWNYNAAAGNLISGGSGLPVASFSGV